MSAIPILMYHNVAAAPSGARLPELYVTPDAFAWQMRVLARFGFRGVSLAEAMPVLRGERAERVAVLTFDDGYADNVENALPVLLRHGFHATCYLTSHALGRYNEWDAHLLNVRKPVMSPDQLRTWCAAGMEVGAHTRTHPRLSTLDLPAIAGEVAGSRADLEDHTGREVAHFCYPYGEYDGRVLSAARAAGYATATTLRRGRARPGDDPLQLRRVSVRGTDPRHLFLLKLLTAYEDRRGRHHHALPSGA